MEAEAYFSTFDGYHDPCILDQLQENGADGRFLIREQHPSAIQKVLWSSFDFMSGPELRFIWEMTAGTSSPSVETDGASINDAESLNSSVSTQSAQYEDIDDPLETDLTTVDDLDTMLQSTFNYFPNINDFDQSACFMNDSRSTSTLTCSTSTVVDPTASYNLLSPEGNSTSPSPSSENTEIPLNSTVKVQCMGTPVDDVDLSRILTESCHQAPSNTVTASGSGSETITEGSSFARLSDAVAEANNHSTGLEDHERDNAGMTSSCVDSGIAGTVSTHSDLSASCVSPFISTDSFITSTPMKSSAAVRKISREDDDVVSLLDLAVDDGELNLSDEEFVSKFVLAEQICTTQLPSDPLLFKMSVLPTRGILISSYIFCTEDQERKSIHALSFLLSHLRAQTHRKRMGCFITTLITARLKWFMERRDFFESVMTDAVPRMKAALSVESVDDVIVRITSELSQLSSLLGYLNRYPLVSPLKSPTVKNSLLHGSIPETGFLMRLISGVLQCQGYCVVVGSNLELVNKILKTAILFVPENWKWCCLKAFRHKYSPYLRLQAIRRSELNSVMNFDCMPSWPICIVDVDKDIICMSSTYSRHRVLRDRLEWEVVANILEFGLIRKARVKLEPVICRTLDCVRQLVNHIKLLPDEDSVRIGLIEQMLLFINNTSLALIQAVQQMSLPDADEKEHPVRGRKFSLSECRKLLCLQYDSWFHAVLARAELLLPDISEFLYSSELQ